MRTGNDLSLPLRFPYPTVVRFPFSSVKLDRLVLKIRGMLCNVSAP